MKQGRHSDTSIVQHDVLLVRLSFKSLPNNICPILVLLEMRQDGCMINLIMYITNYYMYEMLSCECTWVG
jgi:hypothetical protein